MATYVSGQVTDDELQREANRLPPALREEFATPDGLRELASAMVDKRLLAGEAKKRSLSDDPRFQNAAYDLVIEGESYRPRQKPTVDKAGPPPERPVEKRPVHPRQKRRR